MKTTTLAAAVVTMFGMNASALACGDDAALGKKPKVAGERMGCNGKKDSCAAKKDEKAPPKFERMGCNAKKDSCAAKKDEKAPPKA